MRFLLLTCLEQYHNSKKWIDAVKRQISQGLQEGHGADKGVAITTSCSCLFCDFETCKKIDAKDVRLLSLHVDT